MVKKTGMLFAAFAACLLVGGVTAKGADGTILERTASKASLDEPPMTLPEGPVAKATVNGVTGREPKAGTGPFLDREYLLAEMPAPLNTLDILPVDMDGEKTLEVTTDGNLYMLTPQNPDNCGVDLAKQGFRRLSGNGSEFALFVRKKDLKPRNWGTFHPTQEQAMEQRQIVETWVCSCRAGDRVKFAKWALPLVRREKTFVPSRPLAPPYDGAASRIRPKLVIVVGLDGFAGVHFDKGRLPNLKAMKKEGAWSLNSRSILPTSSSCNWHSFFTCCGFEQHGYNSWDTQVPARRPKAVNARGYTPDFVSEFRATRPEAKIDYVFEWIGMDFTADCAAATLATNVPYAAHATTDVVVKRILQEKPDFLYVHYDNPDAAGHRHGWGTPEYITGCEEVDACLGRIREAIKAAGIADETVLAVVSDHGGIGKRHGGTSEDEFRGIFFLSGKRVKAGMEMSSVNIYDVGATVAALLGVTPPAVWIGRPCDGAFDR